MIPQQFLGFKNLSFVGDIIGFAPNYITPINSTIFDLDQHGFAVDVLGLIMAWRYFNDQGKLKYELRDPLEITIILVGNRGRSW